VPLKNAVPRAQKGPMVDFSPAKASVRAAMASHGLCKYALRTKPRADEAAATATCHRLSPVRSEWLPVTSIATIATK
jgi:hypothetical protein